MLTLQLHPSEFRDLLGYLRDQTRGINQLPLAQQNLSLRLMLEYANRMSPLRIQAWKSRSNSKIYKLRIPVTVGLAIYHFMLGDSSLTAYQQGLLAALDAAILNYRDPGGPAHTIGELIGFTPYLTT